MHSEDSSDLIRTSPEDYFGFPACRTCFWKSCKELRYGGVYPGKFMFVHSRNHYGSGCVFTARSFEEVESLLEPLPMYDLDFYLHGLMSDMSPGGRMHYDQRHFVWDYTDRAGRIAYLRYLWNQMVFVCLRIPHNYRSDARLRAWLHATSGGHGFQLKPFEAEDEGPALTDALAEEMTRAHPSLERPAWSHTAETRREQSPKEAAYDDAVLLTAEVRNIVDGASVTFEVFDMSVSPPRSVARVRGKVREQQARAGVACGAAQER